MKKIFFSIIAVILTINVTAQIVITSTQASSYTESTPMPKIEKPKYRPTGPFVQLSAYGPTSVAVGSQFTHCFMMAAGFGLNKIDPVGRNDWSKPLYLETRLSTPKYAFSLFVDAKIGIDVSYIGFETEFLPVGLFSVGFNLYNWGFSVGWNVYRDYNYNYYYDDYGNRQEYYRLFLSEGLTFSVEYRIPFRAFQKLVK